MLPKQYKCLNTQEFVEDSYSIVPIRYEDRVDIMNWRNSQIFHLRQKEPLTLEQQDLYFNTTVKSLFQQDKPDQILFSYLENGICIGYGGLVHIDWINMNAEISFIMNPILEKDYFSKHWGIYLGLIEKIAFESLYLNKIYTYAFDLRPHLYTAVEAMGYTKEARLRNHYLFNQQFIDVVIHSKLKNETSVVNLREAKLEDAMLLFFWANDEDARKNSLSTKEIQLEEHLTWFSKKLNNSDSKIFILLKNKIPVGTIRIDTDDNFKNISYFIDKNFRGYNLGFKIVKLLIEEYSKYNYKAIVKKNNYPSNKIFEKLGFTILENNNQDLNIYIKEAQ